ncbi:FecR domain-containing protein [Chitinophaga sp. Hz27]|uniref:FecR domain-containing protein n=1 Tax=Chitinophaga sp. Hz27 TaxID=3347169 RepID=UPI0035D872C2
MNYRPILERIAAGQHTPEDVATLQQWLQQQPAEKYHAIMLEYESIMVQSNSGAADEALFKRINQQIDSQSSIRTISWWKYAAAACLAAVIAAGAWWLYPRQAITKQVAILPGKDKATLQLAGGRLMELDTMATGSQWSSRGLAVAKADSGLVKIENAGNVDANSSYSELRTPRGGQFAMILPDGSRVWLNAASRLRFTSNFIKERKIILEGEACFDVAQHANLPFKVEAGGQDIAVLGTSFNISAYPDENKISTTLLTGAVKVQHQQQSVVLQPGQQAAGADNELMTISNVNTDNVIAWKKGWFVFEDNDIKMIMRQISRWYDVDVVYEEDLTGITLTGAIQRKQHIEDLLYVLEAAGKARFTIRDQKIYVSKKLSTRK